MIASKKKHSSKFTFVVTLLLCALNFFSCIKDNDYNETAKGRIGTDLYIYRWHSSYIFDETTGITDTIFPNSSNEEIRIEIHDRFQVFRGSELLLDLDLVGGGTIDSYRDERLCDQIIGGEFMLLSGDHKVYYKFEGGGYYQFWQVPFLDGTTYDSPNLYGNDRQCKSYSRFTYEIIHY